MLKTKKKSPTVSVFGHNRTQCRSPDAYMVSQLTQTSCGLMSSAHSTCQRDRSHGTSSLSPADVKAAPGGPCGREAQHLPCPVVTVGKYKPGDSSGSLLAASAARRPQSAEKQKQATWEALLFTKARGKERTFPAPTPPLARILPTTSIITTNKYSRRQAAL